MLDSTFKDRVRNLLHPKFEECAAGAKAAYSRRSADLARRGHVHSSATLSAQHEARVSEKEEQIRLTWEVLQQVMAARQVGYSDELADDLKAELQHYGSYRMSGVPEIQVKKGDETIKRRLDEDFETKRTQILKRYMAEIDIYVDGIREAPEACRKEYEQKFRILLSPGQAEKDFEQWAHELGQNKLDMALLFIDIDHFKSLNEAYGHTTIDRTLFPEFMTLIRDLVRFRGEAYKYGGEEFLVILPNHDRTEALAFAEKLRVSIEAKAFLIDKKGERITVSIGVALFPAHGSRYPDVLEKANEAERSAKSKRNVVQLAQ